jgi:hypothetical protein
MHDHLGLDHVELAYADLEPLDEQEIFNSVKKLTNLPSPLDTLLTVESITFDHDESNIETTLHPPIHHFYHISSIPLPSCSSMITSVMKLSHSHSLRSL